MELSKLGYTSKWIKFGLLNEDLFNSQFAEFETDKEGGSAHFRYNTFMKWFASKSVISDRDIDRFLVLAHEDEDHLMAGNAVTALFTSALISEDQFTILKLKIPEFGKWTNKLIAREVLTRQLINAEITDELYNKCLDYKQTFDDNRPLVMLIDLTENIDILTSFGTSSCGKRIKTLADKKLRKLKREAEKG